MTKVTRQLLIFTALVYGLGGVGLYLRAPDYIVQILQKKPVPTEKTLD